MFFKDDDGQQALVLAFVFALVALVVSSVIGLAIQTAFDTGISAADNSGAGKRFSKSDQSKTTAAPALANSSSATAGPMSEALAATNAEAEAEAAQAASDAASIRVESGVVKFYFASGRAELAPASAAVLADLIADAQSGRKLVISGFHDATGEPVRNAELARQRALAVSTLLKISGVSAQQIELSKPQQAKQEEGDAEARRVEVRLQ